MTEGKLSKRNSATFYPNPISLFPPLFFIVIVFLSPSSFNHLHSIVVFPSSWSSHRPLLHGWLYLDRLTFLDFGLYRERLTFLHFWHYHERLIFLDFCNLLYDRSGGVRRGKSLVRLGSPSLGQFPAPNHPCGMQLGDPTLIIFRFCIHFLCVNVWLSSAEPILYCSLLLYNPAMPMADPREVENLTIAEFGSVLDLFFFIYWQ